MRRTKCIFFSGTWFEKIYSTFIKKKKHLWTDDTVALFLTDVLRFYVADKHVKTCFAAAAVFRLLARLDLGDMETNTEVALAC